MPLRVERLASSVFVGKAFIAVLRVVREKLNLSRRGVVRSRWEAGLVIGLHAARVSARHDGGCSAKRERLPLSQNSSILPSSSFAFTGLTSAAVPLNKSNSSRSCSMLSVDRIRDCRLSHCAGFISSPLAKNSET